MTGTEIIKVETFQDIPVRIVNHEGRDMIPVVDIATALKLDRSNLTKLLKRNEKLFDGHKGVVKFTTPGGVQELVCLTQFGTTGLLYKIDASRSKVPEIQDRILAFQKWATETLTKIIKGETVPIPVEAIDNIVRQHLSIADSLVQFAHVDRGIAISVALANAEFQTGHDLTVYKNLIRKDRQQPPGLFTPTEIGQQISIDNPRVINQALVNMGMQKRINGEWVLTEVGRNYAEPIPFTKINPGGGSHSGYYLQWSATIIPKVREHLLGIDEIKGKGLLTGHI